MAKWFDELIAEMIEAGLVEEVEPGVIRKTDGQGVKLDYSDFRTTLADLPEEAKDEFQVMLLALMAAPEEMGTPFDPTRLN